MSRLYSRAQRTGQRVHRRPKIFHLVSSSSWGVTCMSLCTKQPCTGRNTQTPGHFNTQTPMPSTTQRCAALLCTVYSSRYYSALVCTARQSRPGVRHWRVGVPVGFWRLCGGVVVINDEIIDRSILGLFIDHCLRVRGTAAYFHCIYQQQCTLHHTKRIQLSTSSYTRSSVS